MHLFYKNRGCLKKIYISVFKKSFPNTCSALLQENTQVRVNMGGGTQREEIH